MTSKFCEIYITTRPIESHQTQASDLRAYVVDTKIPEMVFLKTFQNYTHTHKRFTRVTRHVQHFFDMVYVSCENMHQQQVSQNAYSQALVMYKSMQLHEGMTAVVLEYNRTSVPLPSLPTLKGSGFTVSENVAIFKITGLTNLEFRIWGSQNFAIVITCTDVSVDLDIIQSLLQELQGSIC